ncbi:MAG: TolB family protein, partial [Gammaproteobacteria bacterium]
MIALCRGGLLALIIATPAFAAGEAAPGEAARQIAAEVPATDIWLAELSSTAGNDGPAPVNITRRPGYDNQPAFLDSGRILFTSIGADGQSDIHVYDRQTRATRQLTRTPESEYSPTPLPGGAGLSVVRVEADGTQTLWMYSAEGAPRERLVPALDNVGYHAWIAPNELAVFLVAEPPALRIVPADGDGERRDVVSGIGRALVPVPGRRAVAYTEVTAQDDAAGRIELMVYDAADNKSRPLGDAPGAVEDFAWTPDGR